MYGATRLLGLLACCGSVAVAAAEWRVLDLGTPDPRVTEIRVAAMNDRGEIAGGVTLATSSGPPERAAFVYSRGRFHVFGNTTSEPPKVVRDVNRSGVVVGADTSAFVYDDAFTRIPGIVGFGVANAISDRGTVVGTMATASGWRAFQHRNGITTDLGTLGGDFSEAYGVNRAGEIVGHSRLEGASHTRAFVIERGGAMRALPPLGGRYSSAYAINNRGDVAGAAENENLSKRAFLYSNGAMIDLGTLPGFSTSDAVALNDKRQVVGVAVRFASGDPVVRPFMWQSGIMTDLAALPELAAAGFTSWLLRGEYVGWNGGEGPGIAINEHGQLAGAGLKDGRPRLFVVIAPRGR